MFTKLANYSKSQLKFFLNFLGFEISRIPLRLRKGEKFLSTTYFPHSLVRPSATFSPWLNDYKFMSLYESIYSYSLIDIYRLYELWSLSRQIAIHVQGDILEVGVWRGGSGALLAEAVREFPLKTVYLADTFSGVVKAGKNDTIYKNGEHSDTSPTIVKNLLSSLNLNNTVLLEGVFPDETSSRILGQISLLHIDVDVYDSARDILEWGISKISVGGVIVFDDYGFFGCDGVTKFCNELSRDSNFRFIHNLNGHGIFIKLK